ncbi:GNAT family N-acetyltransferase [Sutterella sp.]|uniref:GNAT family N-acetyltransferase n=1 Tax=Sutterella sp. TaxID=1981025 RepID=UPI0026DF1FEC|nr:GNAT family N-acetyltransferase [Sutterella sp.]MDO5530982.1 GNAT family N-acetyltransferase [Sutterella sp.]
MKIEIESGDWKKLEHPASRVRLMVFVAEQKVPKEEEIDDLDPVSTHFVAWDERHMTLGCARLTPDGHIGRLAVLRPFRARGVGAALLEAVLAEARKRGLPEAVLHAQTHARGFYERYGFAAEGNEFDECGIPHIRMRLAL